MFRPLTIALFLSACALAACRSDHDRRFGDTRSGLNDYTTAPLDTAAKGIPEPDDPAIATEASAERHEPAARAHDREFVSAAAYGGEFAVRSSKLALERDVSPELRDFAQKLVDALRPANEELARLATAAGIDSPDALDAEHQTKLDELARAQGPAFEAAYRSQQRGAHDAAIELFTHAAHECEDAALRDFAERALPMWRKQREILEHGYP